MKKCYLLLAAFVCGMFVSCTDSEEIDIAYQATFEINTDKIVSKYKGFFNTEETFQLGEDADLVIESYLYDENGDLVFSDTKEVNDYGISISINKALSPGKYKLVSLSTVSAYDDNNEKHRGWDFSDTNKLSTFKLSQYYVGLYGVLGMKELDLTINNSPQKYIVDLTPKTSLLALKYNGWLRSYAANKGIRTIYGKDFDYYYYDAFVFGYTADDKCSREGDKWVGSSSLTLDNYWVNNLVVENQLNYIYEIVPDINSIKTILDEVSWVYGYVIVFPGHMSYKLSYREFWNHGSTFVEDAFDWRGIEIADGKQYQIDIDCVNLNVQIKEAASTRSIEEISDGVKSALFRNSFISPAQKCRNRIEYKLK